MKIFSKYKCPLWRITYHWEQRIGWSFSGWIFSQYKFPFGRITFLNCKNSIWKECLIHCFAVFKQGLCSFLTQRTSSLEAKCKLDNLPNLIQLSLRSIWFVDIICLISFVLDTKNAVNVFIISRFLTRIYANSINVNRVKNFVSQFVSQFIRVLFWSCSIVWKYPGVISTPGLTAKLSFILSSTGFNYQT